MSAVRWSQLRRGALGALLGVAPLASVLSATPASAATNTLVFAGGASGGGGAYAVTVPYATPPSYVVVVADTADPSATITLSVSSGTAGCSLSSPGGTVVAYTAAGSCVITATASGADKDQGQGVGDGNQSTQASTLTLTITPLAQTIMFTNAPPAAPVVGSTYTVSAAGGASGNPVTFTVDPSSTSGCAIAGDTVTLSPPAGTCTIDATQAGGGAYAPAAPVHQTVTSVLAPQTITFTNAPPAAPVVGSTYTVSAAGGASGNPVTFTVDPSSTSGCAIAGDTVTLSPPAGTCTIDATQAGGGAYAPAAPVHQTVTSVLAPQTITFTNPNPDSIVLGSAPTFQIDASASGDGSLAFATISSTCAVSASGTISNLEPGTCVVRVSAAATSYDAPAASATFTLTVLTPPVSPPVSPPPVSPPVTTPVVTTAPTLPPIVIPVSPPAAPKPKPKPRPKPVARPAPKPRPKPVPRPAPARSIVIKPFTEGSYSLTKPLMAQVWRLATLIKRLRYRSVTLTGYTDNVFTPAMDAVLIHERAVAVLHRLSRDLRKLRIANVRLSIGSGTSIQLVSLNTTAARRALNRRVVATLSAG
ncbi:MAG: hypothetical protein ACP5PB_09310 [Acidimicrobiales bacterium]